MRHAMRFHLASIPLDMRPASAQAGRRCYVSSYALGGSASSALKALPRDGGWLT
jgi:hypothetical protein